MVQPLEKALLTTNCTIPQQSALLIDSTRFRYFFGTGCQGLRLGDSRMAATVEFCTIQWGEYPLMSVRETPPKMRVLNRFGERTNGGAYPAGANPGTVTEFPANRAGNSRQ